MRLTVVVLRPATGEVEGTEKAARPVETVTPAVSGRESIDHQILHSHREQRRKVDQPSYREITEFDVREDLRSWSIKAK